MACHEEWEVMLMENEGMKCPSCRLRGVALGNVVCQACFDGYVRALRKALGAVGVTVPDEDMGDLARSMLLDALWKKLGDVVAC